jgi:sentrin-specific protease 8
MTMSLRSSCESDPILVSYHESIIRQSNLKTLYGSCWLDDSIITFAFEYLHHEQNYNHIHHLFQFVAPSIVQLLKMTDDAFAEQFLPSLDFLHRTFLINNVQVNTFGGTHWSLLVLLVQGI